MSKELCEENTFDILHKYSEKELADIIYEFGEESFSRKIAKAIKINLNISRFLDKLSRILESFIFN